MSDDCETSPLKNKILHGGLWLTLRENVNLVVRTFGVIILTRFLAPDQYGVFIAINAICTFICSVSDLGVNVFLTRHSNDSFKDAVAAARTAIAITSLFSTSIAFMLIPAIERATHLTGIAAIAVFMFSCIPIYLFRVVSLGCMERDLRYKEISAIEIGAQVLFYLVSIPLAVAKMGEWAPAAGVIAMNVYLCIMTHKKANYTIAFSTNRAHIMAVFKFGLGYSFSNIGWQMRALILPFIVAPIANAQSVGYIALATRIADSLNLLREATRRMGIGALSKVQDDIKKFRATIASGIGYQMIAVGPTLVLLVILSPFIITFFLGQRWSAVVALLPFVAFNTMCNAFGSMQTSALYVKGKSIHVALSFFCQYGITGLAAWFFIHRYGIIGYGYALVMPIPAYLILMYSIRRVVGTVDYRPGVVWFAAFAIPLFHRQLGYWTIACIAVPFLIASTRSQIFFLIKSLIPKGVLKRSSKGVAIVNPDSRVDDCGNKIPA